MSIASERARVAEQEARRKRAAAQREHPCAKESGGADQELADEEADRLGGMFGRILRRERGAGADQTHSDS